MAVVKTDTEAMMIIECNEEAMEYMEREISDYTLFYAPLTTDDKDVISWNSPNSSRGSATFNWQYCQLSGGAKYWDMKFTVYGNQPFTIFQRLKPTNRRNYSSRLGYPYSLWFEIWELGSWSGRGDVPRFARQEWSGQWGTQNSWTMPLNERHCFVLVRDWTTTTVYKDKVSMNYQDWITPSWNTTTMRFSVNNGYDYYDWYVAHVWVEQRAWTQKDVDKFYKSTKKRMGI